MVIGMYKRSIAGFLAILCVSVAAGYANAQSNAFGGFKHDSNQPIEIAADALEVKQDQQTAVFTGNVEAQQGVMGLEADELKVEYATEGNSGADAGAIRKVIAKGNVFISSKTESAQGAWANYDVVTGIINMGGGVFLTKDDNALEGETLTINLNTGHAKLVKSEGGRVRGVFAPQKKTQ